MATLTGLAVSAELPSVNCHWRCKTETVKTTVVAVACLVKSAMLLLRSREMFTRDWLIGKDTLFGSRTQDLQRCKDTCCKISSNRKGQRLPRCENIRCEPTLSICVLREKMLNFDQQWAVMHFCQKPLRSFFAMDIYILFNFFTLCSEYLNQLANTGICLILSWADSFNMTVLRAVK